MSAPQSPTVIMGLSGSGKSSLLATAAEWVWSHHKKVSLLYSSDGGGFPTRVQALVQKGIIRVWRMRSRSEEGLGPETIARACSGYWPSVIDPATGECDPAADLVKPIQILFTMTCPSGHVVKTVAGPTLLTPQLCPTCKVLVNQANMHVSREQLRHPWFNEVGAVFYDGLTSMSSWILNDLAGRAGQLELKGEEGSIGGKIHSGTMHWGSNNRSHVGFAQTRIEEFVALASGIPGLVIAPIFTALVDEATDRGGLAIRGLKLAGSARTADSVQWFSNCVEALVVKNASGFDVHRLCLSEWIDDLGIRHLAKTRTSPGFLPKYLEDPDAEGGAFSQFNLGLLFDHFEAALAQELAAADAAYPDAPGLPEGLVSLRGEAIPGQAPSAPTVAHPTTPPTAPKVVARRGRPPLAAAAPTETANTPASPLPPPTPTPGIAATPAVLDVAARVIAPPAVRRPPRPPLPVGASPPAATPAPTAD